MHDVEDLIEVFDVYADVPEVARLLVVLEQVHEQLRTMQLMVDLARSVIENEQNK